MAPPVQKLQGIYASQMTRRHDFGYPLYEPASRKIIQPGVCGYLDAQGQWNPIADLRDLQELETKGYLPPSEPLERAPDDRTISWGPKCSESVVGGKVGVEAGVDAAGAGVPVEAAVVYRYSSSSDFGAILMTESPVWREALYYDRPFREWIVANSARILQKRPEVKEHGVWVVRWIYSTPKASLNAWTSKGKQVTIGFKAKVVGAGEVGPSAEWYESSADSGWIHSEAEEGDRKVVFMGGLHFEFSKSWTKGERLKDSSRPRRAVFGLPMNRSGFADDELEQEMEVDLGGGQVCEVKCTEYGTLDLSVVTNDRS